jgi:hypothetical protein
MELFRFSRSIYGQQVLVGASWDLLPWFFAAGLAFIVLHALYKVFLGSRGAMAMGRKSAH